MPRLGGDALHRQRLNESRVGMRRDVVIGRLEVDGQLRFEREDIQVLPDAPDRRPQDPQVGFARQPISPRELLILADGKGNGRDESTTAESQISQPAIACQINQQCNVRPWKHSLRPEADASLQERHRKPQSLEHRREEQVLFETITPAPIPDELLFKSFKIEANWTAQHDIKVFEQNLFFAAVLE